VVSATVLIIAPDERWLRVLEATLKLGGYQPIARRSVDEALRLRVGDEQPMAVVLDLGADSGGGALDSIQTLLRERNVLSSPRSKVVVILPELLGDLRTELEGTDVEVVVRPYPPSRLYAALGPAVIGPAASDSAADAAQDRGQ